MPRKLIVPPTQEEKTIGLERVIYSISMVINAYDYLFKPHLQNKTETFLNICVCESFLTHLRSLTYFISSDYAKFDSDILMVHFTGHSLEIESQFDFFTNKLVSHLTFQSIDTVPNLNIREYLNELFPKFLYFLEHTFWSDFTLNPDLVDDRLELIERLQNELKIEQP